MSSTPESVCERSVIALGPPPPQPQHMSFEVKSSSSQQPHADGHVMVYPQGSPSSSIASPFVLVQLPEYVPPNVRSQVFSVGPVSYTHLTLPTILLV